MNRGVFGLVVLLAIVGALMYCGYTTSRRLELRLRAASALIPLLALLGTGFVLFALTACGLGDVFTPAQRAECNRTISLAVPAAGAYLLVVAVCWVRSMLLRNDPQTQRVWLRIAIVVALIPNLVAAAAVLYAVIADA